MSSINLGNYRTEHISEKESFTKLEQLLGDGKPRRLTLDQLATMIGARSRDEWALILGELASDGLIDFYLQVRSPSSNQPLANYSSLAEIPSVLHDMANDTDVEVTMDNIRPIYSFPPKTRK